VTCPASSVRSAPISRTRPSHGTTPLDWRDYCCTTRATAPICYRFNIKRLKRLAAIVRNCNARAAIHAALWLQTKAIDMLQSVPHAHHS